MLAYDAGEDEVVRAPVHSLADDNWQMSPGERAAIEGLLAQIRPALAIEIGTAQGGSTRRIAHYSNEVHTFDLAPEVDRKQFFNVTFHVGDSHELLPEFLHELEVKGRNVDFALVDGDHRAAGVCADLDDLLRSHAVRQTCIVMHDTMNEEVRAGLDRMDWAAYPSVSYVDLAFTEADHSFGGIHERWGGLGLVLVDESRCNGCRTGVVARRRGLGAHGEEIAWHLTAPARWVHREVRHRAKSLVLRIRNSFVA